MQNQELSRQIESIKSLLQHASTAIDDIEILGHWGRYLCVLTAGFLENSIQEVYTEFVRRSSSPAVARFAESKLERINNPNAGEFIGTARSFKPEWADDLRAFLDDDGKRRRNAINSIMTNRNQIAHGVDVGISVDSVREYLLHCIEVVEFIEEQVQGN